MNSKVRSQKRYRQKVLNIGGRVVPVTVTTNPRARKLIVRVHPSTGEVAIVAPNTRALERAMDFARSETDWISDRLAAVPPPVPLGPGDIVPFRGRPHTVLHEPGERGGVWLDAGPRKAYIVATGRREHVGRRVRDWLRAQARTDITEAVSQYANALGVKPARIALRDPSTRWGSCSTSGVLSFSWRLVLAPPYVLNYVAAHEVAHLVHMNHGNRFWTLVEHLVGDTDRPREWLRDEGGSLHRYGPA